MAHAISKKYSETIKRTVREKAMGSKKGEVLSSVDGSEIPESFLVQIQVCSDKTTTLLKSNALIAHTVHMVWLNSNAKQTRYLNDHGDTFLGILPVDKGEVEREGGDAGLEKDVFRYGFTSSKFVLLGAVKSHTFSSSSQQRRIVVLSPAILSCLEQLSTCTHTGSEVTLWKVKVWIRFQRAASYFCDILES